MKLEIVEKDYNVSDRFKEVLEAKLEKIKKYFPNDITVKVFCRKIKNMYKMELNLSSKNMYYRAEVSNNQNMYSNIDLIMPKLERQIVKSKEKNIDKNRAELVMPDFFEFFEDEEEALEHKVVKQKRFEIGAPITMAEAQNMLEMSDHDFYIYNNAETNKVNIIYKRKDGDFGNIEIE